MPDKSEGDSVDHDHCWEHPDPPQIAFRPVDHREVRGEGEWTQRASSPTGVMPFPSVSPDQIVSVLFQCSVDHPDHPVAVDLFQHHARSSRK
jgi:hypothetical protein